MLFEILSWLKEVIFILWKIFRNIFSDGLKVTFGDIKSEDVISYSEISFSAKNRLFPSRICDLFFDDLVIAACLDIVNISPNDMEYFNLKAVGNCGKRGLEILTLSQIRDSMGGRDYEFYKNDSITLHDKTILNIPEGTHGTIKTYSSNHFDLIIYPPQDTPTDREIEFPDNLLISFNTPVIRPVIRIFGRSWCHKKKYSCIKCLLKAKQVKVRRENEIQRKIEMRDMLLEQNNY